MAGSANRLSPYRTPQPESERVMTHCAGIDVGAREVVVALNEAASTKTRGKTDCFANNPKGFADLLPWLRRHQVRHVVLEATGVYHLDLALALHADPTMQVMVLNPKVAKHFAQARGARTKTDAVDAALLAQFAQYMPFEPWQPPSEAVLALRACARRLAALTHQRTRAKNQRHALCSTDCTPDFILEDARLSVTQLDAQIDSLEKRTQQLIKADDFVNRQHQLLLSIKGVGEKSAIQLLGELLALPEDLRAKQWVALAGLDPRHHQSGSSVEKKARISKAGNRALRTALFMPAMCAVRHVPQVKAYAEHLVQHRGLRPIQALCAVMRKLLHAMHGMWKSQTNFDPERFYKPHTENPSIKYRTYALTK